VDVQDGLDAVKGRTRSPGDGLATAAGDDLERRLLALDPGVETARRVIAAPNA
jgi:hypothetical protein